MGDTSKKQLPTVTNHKYAANKDYTTRFGLIFTVTVFSYPVFSSVFGPSSFFSPAACGCDCGIMAFLIPKKLIPRLPQGSAISGTSDTAGSPSVSADTEMTPISAIDGGTSSSTPGSSSTTTKPLKLNRLIKRRKHKHSPYILSEYAIKDEVLLNTLREKIRSTPIRTRSIFKLDPERVCVEEIEEYLVNVNYKDNDNKTHTMPFRLHGRKLYFLKLDIDGKSEVYCIIYDEGNRSQYSHYELRSLTDVHDSEIIMHTDRGNDPMGADQMVGMLRLHVPNFYRE